VLKFKDAFQILTDALSAIRNSPFKGDLWPLDVVFFWEQSHPKLYNAVAILQKFNDKSYFKE